jgi:hypothetical protein
MTRESMPELDLTGLEPITCPPPLVVDEPPPEHGGLLGFGPGFDPTWGMPVLAPRPSRPPRPVVPRAMAPASALVGVGLIAVAAVLLLSRGDAVGDVPRPSNDPAMTLVSLDDLDLGEDLPLRLPDLDVVAEPAESELEEEPEAAPPRRATKRWTPPVQPRRPEVSQAEQPSGQSAARGARGATAEENVSRDEPVPTLDQLLAGAVNPDRAGSTPAAQQSLSRSQVSYGLRQVAPAVRRCSLGEERTVRVDVTIDGDTGRVVAANVSGPDGGTSTGSCIARAVRTATFPRFDGDDLNVRGFPYVL